MFTIGADPEVLLKNKQGEFVSAIGKIPGTKENPVPMGIGMVHHDNVMGEFSIPPATDADEFASHIITMSGVLGEIADKHDLHVSNETVGEFDPISLNHPAAINSGCDVDFNVYTRAENHPPQLFLVPIRCAGGHVHIGVEGFDRVKLVKALDYLITLPMLEHDDPRRRQLYGGAGCFRNKPYGIEYRTPSNKWIFDKEYILWVYDRVKKAVMDHKSMDIPDEVASIINEHDVDKAKSFRI